MARCRRRLQRDDILAPELLLQLENDPLGGLLADAGDRLETRRIAERDRPPQLGRGRTRDDGERHLRPDSGYAQEVEEKLALSRLREPIELKGVLADVEVRLERHLGRVRRTPKRAGRRRHEVADAADVEDEAVRRASRGSAAKTRDHPAASRRGGAIA